MDAKYIEGVPQKQIAYNAKSAEAAKTSLGLNWCGMKYDYKKKRAS
jgi:hypothetical protein